MADIKAAKQELLAAMALLENIPAPTAEEIQTVDALDRMIGQYFNAASADDRATALTRIGITLTFNTDWTKEFGMEISKQVLTKHQPPSV